jgi:putative CocE/NonD family hydrolase
VGAVGSSYDGILASLLARTGHPALKAIAPRFSAWDNFADEWAPGGLPAEGPMGEWFSLVNDLDRGDITDIFGWTAGVVTGGVRPVRAEILPKAMQEHQRNIDLDAVFARLQFRDDVAFGHSIDDTSPHSLGPAADEVPVYAYGGWFDAGLARGDARRFVAGANPGNRLRLGPWFHAGQFNASPFADHKDDFDHAKELLRFFDYHLRGVDEGFSREPRVAYYTMGPGDPGGVVGWRSADTWPVPGAETRTLFLSAGHRMSATPPAPESAADAYTVDLTAASDPGSRWGLIVGTGKKRGYGDQADLDEKLLVYTGAPLANAVEVTGHPIVHLFIDANAADGGVFAYLQDVRPDGEVRYVTEGELRLIDRRIGESPVHGDPVPYHSLRREDAEPMVPGEVAEVVFDLLPTSFVFPAGDSIRLAIAGADAGVFAIPDHPANLIYQIHRDRQHPSRIELPTYKTGLGNRGPGTGEGDRESGIGNRGSGTDD